MADLAKYLDKSFEHLECHDLADSPVDALAGVSKADADALKAALGIRTIRDLASNKFVWIAQAITQLADHGR